MVFMMFTVLACTAQNTKNAEGEVSEQEVQQDLDYLASDELLGRATGSQGIEDAAVFIEEKFKNFGLKP